MDARRFLRQATATALTVLALLALTLALPVPLWRTGEHPLPTLEYRTSGLPTVHEVDIWIDTDPACGTGRNRDPDDCIALVSLLVQQPGRIAGVSTIFGNAELDTTDAVARELIREAGAGARGIKVWRGCAQVLSDCSRSPPTAAHRALRSALRDGALTVVALGPLTNLADVLQHEPALARSVVRVIAVMGRRPGHLFHPAEGRGEGAMLFGHGPIFRDLNAQLDPDAVEVVLRAGVPLVLVPYAAARGVVLREQDLMFLAAQGRVGAWTAARSQDWLDFWRNSVGLPGFYPFDLLASAVLHAPGRFRCADVIAWVGRDPMFPLAPRSRALLVAQAPSWQSAPPAIGTAIFCDDVSIEARMLLSRPAPVRLIPRRAA